MSVFTGTASDTSATSDSVSRAVAATRTRSETSLTSDSVRGAVSLFPVGISPTEAVGRPTIWKYGHVLQPVGIARGGGVGVLTLTQVAQQTIRPQGWQETGGVGAPTVTQPGATTIVPVGIPPS